MLLNFTFGNFRSFKEPKTLSMEATSISEHKESLIDFNGKKYLPIAVMYGANSSGKSNVIKAFRLFSKLILSSYKNDRGDELPIDAFCLDDEYKDKNTTFELQFVANEIVYRYGFEYNKTEIVGEWLFEQAKGDDEKQLYNIENGEMDYLNEELFPDGKNFDNVFLGNKLFLSLVVQQAKNPNKSKIIVDWIKKCLNFISGTNESGYSGFTYHMFLHKIAGVNEARMFFKKLDLGFSDYVVEKISVSDIQSDIQSKLQSLKKNSAKYKELKQLMSDLKLENDSEIISAKTKHKVKTKTGQVIEEDFEDDDMESEGTKKIISLSGPIFDTLAQGNVLIVDELDAKLHPFLTREIVKLFTHKETNPKGAQLIFATHDTNLLDLSLLRRDEIWFTEKDKAEATDLYSLVEFKIDGEKIRKDANLEKNYIKGRYGAIPYIN